MTVKFLQRSFLQRLLGRPATRAPRQPGCWSYDGERVVIDLTRAPELGEPGGALRLEGQGLPLRLLVVHGEDGRFYALQNRCTHLGHRRLDPVPGTHTVQCCSVYRSTYSYEGGRIYGPAPLALTTYPVAVESTGLVVRLS